MDHAATAGELSDDLSSAWLEDAARLALRATRDLLEAASGLGFLDINGAEVQASQALRAFMGLAPGPAAAGSDPHILEQLKNRMHPAHRAGWAAQLEAHRRDPAHQPFELDIALASENRGWRWFRCTAASRSGPSGSAERTMIALRDVTQERTAREQAHSAEARVSVLEAELAALRARPCPKQPRSVLPHAKIGAMRALERRLDAVARALARADTALKEVSVPSSATSITRRRLAELAQVCPSIPPAREDDGDLSEDLQQVNDAVRDLSLTALNAQLEALRMETKGAGLAAVAAQMKQLARAAANAVESLEGRVDEHLDASKRQNTERQQMKAAALRAQEAHEREIEDLRQLDLSTIRAAVEEAFRLSQGGP